MKRKFLEDLGLEKEVIDKIMSENGIDIEAQKKLTDNYKIQLETVEEKLKEFDGVDINGLKGEIIKLTNDLGIAKTTYESQMEDMKFTNALEGKISEMNPRNKKAVMALLDTENLKKSKNQDSDIAQALELIKKENDYLFEHQNQTTRRIVSTTDTTPQQDNHDKKAAANEAFRSLFKTE